MSQRHDDLPDPGLLEQADDGATPARLARLRPGDLTPEQAAVHAAITGGRRAAGPRLFDLTDGDGGLLGPFNAMLLAPAIGLPLQELGAALRYAGSLSDRARELVILVVAAHWSSAFERQAHEAVGAHIGLTPEEMAAVARGGPVTLTEPAERAAVAVARALTRDGDLDDATWREARASLGDAGLFEVSTLVGYYATLALQLRLFRVDTPATPGDPLSA